MENQNANDFNAGTTGDLGAGANSGANANNGSQPSGDPGNQQGQQTDPRDAKIAELTRQSQALNRQLVEARRAGNQNPNRSQGANGEQDPNDPAYQYGNALTVLEATVRNGLEPILDLYPELTDQEKSMIRANPLAWASREDMLTLNSDNSLLSIETKIAQLAESRAGNQDNGAQKTTPATVNPNQPGSNAADGAQPDPMEDWAMPMDDLEKKVQGIKRSAATK